MVQASPSSEFGRQGSWAGERAGPALGIHQDMVTTKRTHLVLLEGATGTGKTTLAQWFCQRVDEVGGGTWKMSTHTEEGGFETALDRCLKLLGAAGLDRAGAGSSSPKS